VTAGRTTIKALRRSIIFLVIVAVLYLLLPKLIDSEKSIEYLRQGAWQLLLVAVVLEFIALLGYANLFRHLLDVLDIRLSLRRMYGIVLAGLAVSHVFSAGGAAGWVVSYNALRKKEVPHGLVFVAIAAQNFFNYAVLWALFLLAMAYGLVSGTLSPARYALALVLIGFFLWLTAYGFYLYNRRTKMRRRVAQFAATVNRLSRKERISQAHIDEWLDHLFLGMRRMSTHRGAKRLAATYSCAFWLFDISCLALVFAAFSYRVGFTALVMSYVVAYAVGTLSPTPGGLGAIEGILIGMLVGFGVPSTVAVTVVLVYRLINFWLPIPPGLVSYVAIR
jgi:glycosyltransferase 2 family protein